MANSKQSTSHVAPTDAFKDIEKLEKDLWEAADNLRANSKLTSSDYFMPVLGVIFLRHAANRFETAKQQIEADQTSGKMPKRKVLPADFIARRSLYLPASARFDWIMEQAAVSGVDLSKLVTDAMTAIEKEFEPLLGVLPKDYGIFETKVLEDLMRLFNSERIKQANGDVFGRIYEYFLAKFSIQKAHDNGEFFTPSSIVQMIVNVIEPDHGTVFDPACGSGGMFVQSSHFIEHEGGDTAKKAVFYGQEKNPDTIRIAQMNLAVHGLEGKIADAITYYQDEHTLVGKCDFVMANPPFNVDLVDAERIKGDPRLPFGLPGVNKNKKVSNGNYLWISYFWSYLSKKGRAGFVMSSQSSSAGHGERDVRKKIIETGDVDVMISIRQNFFYTRSVPCELWHFDRAKPAERKDKVLMLDARNVYRTVTRKINDFSPEQMQNLSAIVWLYREQQSRFLDLVKHYLSRIVQESKAIEPVLRRFEVTLADIQDRAAVLETTIAKQKEIESRQRQSLEYAIAELNEAAGPYRDDRKALVSNLTSFCKKYNDASPSDNEEQHTTRKAFEANVEAIRGLIKQIDLLYKYSARVADLGAPLASVEAIAAIYDRRATGRLVKQLDEERRVSVEQLKRTVYFYRQVAWLQDRFPAAKLVAVPGLVKLVDLKAIEAAHWSLTPGSYVDVAPAEVDDDFDFEQTLRDIHIELDDLDKEAISLAETIRRNFEELGA
ncbi:type I restriction-modification system subunit M [Acidicapsa ligni]|uniref:type I restriction-modification system subunit M n=1 Tax=Acidicapsa ligni TaxID=542300 RepID=UPI0021DFCEAF|nr:type I restriction-modification system subunit M [Acidicapsa ligni]